MINSKYGMSLRNRFALYASGVCGLPAALLTVAGVAACAADPEPHKFAITAASATVATLSTYLSYRVYRSEYRRLQL